MFEHWITHTEQVFTFAEFLAFKLTFFALAIFGLYTLVRRHLR